MSVTAIGSQSPGGENPVSQASVEAPATNFLEFLLEDSSPAGAHPDNTAAGPVTGKLLSLLPEVEQGTETDHEVAIDDDGAPESVLAVGMAPAFVAPTPGADPRAMGAPAATASAVTVEASGPSLPITALPSHVLGMDLAASGATPSASAGGSPVDAAVPRVTPSQPGTAVMVPPAYGLEPVEPATIPVPAMPPAPVDVDAPTTTPASAAAAPAAAADAGENRVSITPAGTPILVTDAPASGAPAAAVPTAAPAAGAAPAEATMPPPADGMPETAVATVITPTVVASDSPDSPAAPRSLHGDALAVIRQVADAMQVSIRRGDDVLRLQLRPAELGTVVVHLVQREGGLYAHVRADSPEAVQALQQSLGGLADTLQSQGQVLAGLDVALRQPGEDAAFAFDRSAQRTPRAAGGSAMDPGADTSAPLTPSTPSTSAIDLRA